MRNDEADAPQESRGAGARLPVWRTTRDGLRLLRRHGGTLLGWSVGPFLLILPLIAAFTWVMVTLNPPLPPESTRIRPLDLVDSLVSGLLRMVAIAPIAVAWHRMVLFGEARSSLLRLPAGSVVQYAIYALAMEQSLIFCLYALLARTHTGPSNLDPDHLSPETAVVVMALLIAIPLAIYLWARVSLILPAIAVERSNADITTAWEASARNGWRLALGGMLVSLPLLAISLWMAEIDMSEASKTAQTLVKTVEVLVTAAAHLIWLGFASLSFVRLWPNDAATPLAPIRLE